MQQPQYGPPNPPYPLQGMGAPYQGQYPQQPPPGQGYNQPYPAAQPYAAPPPYPPTQPYAGSPAASYGSPPASNYEPKPAGNRVGDHMVEAPFAGDTFTDKAIRQRFVRKVYLVLTTQLAFTTLLIAIFVFHKPTQNWVQRNSWIYYIAYVVFIGTYIALICCPSVRRKYPQNYICLAILTFAFGYMAAMISSFYNVEAVFITMAITCGVCVAVTIFSIQTKIDFTKCGGLLFCLLIVLILFGFACIIVTVVSDPSDRTRRILQCVYGGLGALVFSLFLAYDTQMIVGGRKYEYSEEDYVAAAVQLYLDVVYIFLFLLQIVGGGNN